MKNLLIFLILLTLLAPVEGRAADNAPVVRSLDFTAFGQIPVLHEGRVKPLESFARAYLLAFYGKNSLPQMTAMAWLAEVLFAPEKAYAREIFNIPNPDVVQAIGLEWRQDHHYSFYELSRALDTYSDTLEVIGNMADSQRTQPQQQLLSLYSRVMTLGIMSKSFSLFQSKFSVKDPGLAEELGKKPDQDLSFLDLMAHEAQILSERDKFKHKSAADLTNKEREIISLAEDYSQQLQYQQSTLFRIVPPQWQRDGDVWTSPWTTLTEGRGSPRSAIYLELWKKLASAYIDNNAVAWQNSAINIRDQAYIFAGSHASFFKTKLEIFYLHAGLFGLALGIYLLCSILLAISFVSGQRGFYRVATVLMPTAALLHLSGIVMRIVIMGRPPVSTLYETTIFVSFIAVLFSLIFEWRRKDAMGLMVGSVIGAVLLFISTRYAADGDTMEMLVAVLNTNFWLATHVVAITIGYGCSLVAGTLGHFYFANKLLRPQNTQTDKHILNMILAAALIAVFFVMLGTILGGIWADQSWGRFWGWDPKENGALLIVLWLLWLLHGWIAGVLSPINFASCMVLTNVVVALSWFGVNLLSVGLHSYGFTDNIALNLGSFCGAEIIFLGVIRFLLATLKPRVGVRS